MISATSPAAHSPHHADGVVGPQGVTSVLGEQSASQLDVGATTILAFPWTLVESNGEHQILVDVDPDGSIAEVLESDNQDFRMVDILSLPDVAISSPSIRLSPPAPAEGDTVTVSVDIKNLGEQTANQVLLRVLPLRISAN